MEKLALRIEGGTARSERAERGEQVIAVLAPMSGSAGIWGPSCISCAQIAVAEVNEAGGIAGSRLVPYFLDSDDGNVSALEAEVAGLIQEKAVAAIVGMNVSSVRQRLNKIVAGRIPYVYTPLYEGNEHSPNVFAIGETPADQLEPAIRNLTETLKVRNWALIGNDYVWPRSSHAVARKRIGECGGTVVFDGYVPFGLKNAEWLAERIARAKPDIVLVSLVGQDAVEFNRAFGAMDLDRRMFRLSTAVDENVLLATGEENTKRLFVASGYFSALKTDPNEAFKERYRACHDAHPPVLNALGQSLYEGVHFYAEMRANEVRGRGPGPIRYRSARSGAYISNDRKDLTIYLSRADGHQFAILGELA
ncbi:substrate-binding domain-containing protein [Microbaculum sp. FT89]|uniref:substrate-binding domain-containing protein n=1 Tax=Microbaculum sp. FT89 TaxID=3447298 RepID=UPI003F53C0DB